jgi:hypothetical protein
MRPVNDGLSIPPCWGHFSLSTPLQRTGHLQIERLHSLAPDPFTKGVRPMSLGLILIIILVIFLFGGFSGRFGGYGYGYGHGGMGIIGIVLIVLVVLLLMGRL